MKFLKILSVFFSTLVLFGWGGTPLMPTLPTLGRTLSSWEQVILSDFWLVYLYLFKVYLLQTIAGAPSSFFLDHFNWYKVDCSTGHSEHQPHKYTLSWTTSRIGMTSKGGIFYASTYGICIELTKNTLVIWKPKDIYGTSFQDHLIDQPDHHFSQMGLAIVTSSKLPSIWAQYQKDALSCRETADQLELDPSGEDDMLDNHPSKCRLDRGCPICLPDSELSDNNTST